MSYTPTLDDLPPDNNNTGYSPTLDDLPPENNPGRLNSFGQGAFKNLGETAIGAANLVNRIGSWFDEPSMPGQAQPSLQSTKIPDLLKNYGGAAQNSHPNYFDFGNFVGNTAPYLAMPEVDAAEVVGKYAPVAKDFLASSKFGKFLKAALNNTATAVPVATLNSAVNNPEQSLSNLATSGLTGGLFGGMVGTVLPAGINLGKNILGRAYTMATTDADKLASDYGDQFNNLNNAANNAGIRVQPTDYQDYLQSQIKTLNNGTSKAVNSEFLKDLEERLKDSQTSPQIKSDINLLSDAHQQLRNLGLAIKNAPHADASKLYTGAYNALKNDIINSLPPDLSNSWSNLMNIFSQNVPPLRKYPTSLPGVGLEGTAALTALHFPGILQDVLLGATGLHGALKSSPTINLVRRMGSSAFGGPSSVTDNIANQQLAPYISKAIAANSQPQGNKQ